MCGSCDVTMSAKTVTKRVNLMSWVVGWWWGHHQDHRQTSMWCSCYSTDSFSVWYEWFGSVKALSLKVCVFCMNSHAVASSRHMLTQTESAGFITSSPRVNKSAALCFDYYFCLCNRTNVLGRCASGVGKLHPSSMMCLVEFHCQGAEGGEVVGSRKKQQLKALNISAQAKRHWFINVPFWNLFSF